MFCTGFTQSVWETRKPLPLGNDLESVAYGNKKFIVVGMDCTILSSKADAITGNIISHLDSKATKQPGITNFSNRIIIQMPDNGHAGKSLRISLFNTNGRNVYSTKMKMTDRKLNLPVSGISRLSGGVYHMKITNGKGFKYYGSVAITQ